jgi:multiple sugar transport system substrate-binding protein
MDRFIEQIDKFNAEHTGIKAAYVLQQGMEQKLLTAIVGGGVPDVLIWDRFQTSLYAPKGALMAVDSFVSKDGLDLNIFYEEAVEEMRYNGNLYGLPFVVDNRALFYNKELFREAGLDPERPPQTWDELEAAAIKLTKWEGGKLTRAGFALNDVGLFNTWILQAGGDMLTEDLQNTAFNSPAGLAVLQYWDKLLNKSKVYAVGFASNLAEGEDPFVTGKIAIKWDGPWAISTLERYAETLDYGVAPLPAGPGGHRGARMGGFGMAIAKGAKNADQGWELVKYLTADKENNRNIARATGNIPANRQAAQYDDFQKDPHFRGIVENMEFAKIRPPVPGYSQIEGDATIPNFQLFMSGQMTAQEALADAQIKGDKILRENRE